MNIVITGANRGIGLQLTTQYSKDHSVYALCRTPSAELTQLDGVQIIPNTDVCNTESIHAALGQCPNIDILINNAGLLHRVSLDHWDIESMDKQWHVNALAPIMVARASLQKLTNGSKVIFITSRMGSINDNTSGSHYAYRMSKAALNMGATSFAIDVRDKGIHVGIIHPGWVQTDMTGHTGNSTAEAAATHIIDRISNITASNSGQFIHANGDTLPW